MIRLSDETRTQYRGWSVDYSIRLNTKYNKFCLTEQCAPVEKVLSDAQMIYDFMTSGAETASVHKLEAKRK